MQIHPTTAMADDGELPVTFSGGTLAIIELGVARLFVENAADADRLIKAAVEAKRLLTGDNPYPPVTALCNLPEEHDDTAPDATIFCNTPRHHAHPALDEGSQP